MCSLPLSRVALIPEDGKRPLSFWQIPVRNLLTKGLGEVYVPSHRVQI